MPMTSRCLILAVLVLSPLAAQKPLSSLLASREVGDRLTAIERLRSGEEPRPEARLQKLLRDRDWEVVEAAIRALAEVGSDKSTERLAKLARSGPVRRLRLAAAEALGRLDPEEGARRVSKRLTKEDAPTVADALARIGGKAAGELLERMIGSKEPEVQRLGYLGLGAGGGPEHRGRFEEMLGRPDLLIRLAGLEGLARCGDPAVAGTILAHLGGSRLSDVEVRRVRFAFRRLMAGLAAGAPRDAAAATLFAALKEGGAPRQLAALMRLLGELGRGPAPLGPRDRYEAILLEAGLSSPSALVRATAAQALEALGSDRGADRLVALAGGDPSDVVRLHALRRAVGGRGKGHAEALAAALRDRALPVREEAAALAGRHALEGLVAPLIEALGDDAWQVRVSAAISLGRLRAREALPALSGLAKDRDWKLRGAAALALGWLRDAEATERLLPLLDDPDPSVEATAHRALQRITGHDAPPSAARWKDWWRLHRDGFDFQDRKKAADEARAKGYAAGDYGVYKDIDVIVLLTREGGDNIQLLLERLGIEHRRTRVGQVSDAALHPFAIFVANCPGEIQDADVERIQWFVRTGGYLFSSCWALSHTVEKSFRGIVSQHPTPTQVLDVVEAEPVDPGDPLVRNVFRPGTRTQYVLEGSHIIAVHDPVRFHVLVDSPACAARWGEGNMAGYFTVGHGLVFDSANHFDLQGMKRGEIPGSPTGRKALAMDRLGYDHAEIRDLEQKGAFKTAAIAARRLEDLSMFRMITNFVRAKRRAEL